MYCGLLLARAWFGSDEIVLKGPVRFSFTSSSVCSASRIKNLNPWSPLRFRAAKKLFGLTLLRKLLSGASRFPP